MQGYHKTIHVRWSDCDANRHVRHSAYYDYGAHTRIGYFMDQGFPIEMMDELAIGPILFEEKCSFIREIKPGEIITVHIKKRPINEDASRWTLFHEIFKEDGTLCAHITAVGAWMDLEKRKLTAPPVDIASSLHALPEGQAYKR